MRHIRVFLKKNVKSCNLFLSLLAVNVTLLYTLLSVIRIEQTDVVSQFPNYLERLRGTFMTKNCGAIWARVKLKLQKLRKCTDQAH